MRTIITKIYKYEELTDQAKEKARDWYREGNLDYDWYEYCFEWFGQISKCVGVTLDDHPVKLMNGKTGYEPAIYFSGFSSQGDGASFKGRYAYQKGWKKKLAGETTDQELFNIGETLASIQKKHNYLLVCRIDRSGSNHYCHEHTMGVNDIERSDGKEIKDTTGLEEDLTECFRDMARWLYLTLEKEYDYLNSDEAVDESIVSNGYEFEEDGSIA
mgnify:CR=1 FL=1